MKSKQPVKKVLDVSKPKKRPADARSAPQLVIPKRSVIVPVSDASEETPAGPDAEQLQPKRVAKPIEPRADADLAEPDQTPAAPAQPPEAAADPETPAEETPEPNPQADKEPAANEAAEDPATEENKEAATKATKASPHVHQAVEDAKRQQEIQKFIDNREFFVPINAVARKRSLKVSIALALVELLLGVFLVDLMLDAGIIQLIEKIPHTNFFGLGG